MQKLEENKKYDLEEITKLIANLVKKEIITSQEAENINPMAILKFTQSSIWEEMKEAKSAVFLLGGRIRGCRNFELPGTEIHRTLVCIEKVSGCPKKYPRKAGTAAKNPL